MGFQYPLFIGAAFASSGFILLLLLEADKGKLTLKKLKESFKSHKRLKRNALKERKGEQRTNSYLVKHA